MKGMKEHAKETQKKVAKGKGNYLVKMFKEKATMAQKARVAGKPAPAGKKQTSSSGREGKKGDAGLPPRHSSAEKMSKATPKKVPAPTRKPSPPQSKKASPPKKTYKRTVAKDSKKFNYQSTIRKGLGSRNR